MCTHMCVSSPVYVCIPACKVCVSSRVCVRVKCSISCVDHVHCTVTAHVVHNLLSVG